MALYLWATLECNSEANRADFIKALSVVVEAMEKQGWKLLDAYKSVSGSKLVYYDLWELRDMAHFKSAAATFASYPGGPEALALLKKTKSKETTEFMQRAEYAHGPNL